MEIPENADQSFQAPIPNKEIKQMKLLVLASIILSIFLVIVIKKDKTTCEINLNNAKAIAEDIKPNLKTMQTTLSSSKEIKK